MNIRVKRRRGQTLIASICAAVVILLLMLASFEAGNIMYKKAHVQNVADSGALEGGLWYARAMNILALSNKVLAMAFAAGIAESAAGDPEAGLDTVHEVQKMQDMIAGIGDYGLLRPFPNFAAAMVIKNGALNNSMSIPVFNSMDCDPSANMPSFNVRRRYADQELKKALNIRDDDADKFYYTSGSGERVYVDKQYVTIDTRIKNRGDVSEQIMTKNNPLYGTKFLKREMAPDKGAVPLDIVEVSPEHSVLVFTSSKDTGQLLKTSFLKDDGGNEIKPALLTAFSYVAVSGGKLDILDIDGAAYSPKISRVKLPCLDSIAGGGTAGLQKMIGAIGNDLILH
jgi:hypothetical protein